jgi:hypothetical protein
MTSRAPTLRSIALVLALASAACSRDRGTDLGDGGSAAWGPDAGLIVTFTDGGTATILPDGGLLLSDGGVLLPDGGTGACEGCGAYTIGVFGDGGCSTRLEVLGLGCCGATYADAFSGGTCGMSGAPAGFNPYSIGTCDGLRVVRLQRWFTIGDSLCIYDDKGALIGTRVSADLGPFCGGSSPCIFAGTVPSQLECAPSGAPACVLSGCALVADGGCAPLDGGDGG